MKNLDRPVEIQFIYLSGGARQIEKGAIELEPWSLSVFLAG
jgi:hypothetical protein